MAFQRATKRLARLRMALIGPSGSGKTFTALNVAQHLGKKVALIDTERGSASKYAHRFSFDVLELENFHPQRYIDAIHEAEQSGYDVLIIDSLSHAWTGKDGALELVDKAAKRTQSSNTFGAWREVTPLHNALVDAMVGASVHLIATIRSKQEHVQEKDEKTGKTVVRKIGLQPVQRDGLEYEFDVIGDLTMEHDLIIGKTRCEFLDGQMYHNAGADVARVLTSWLSDGEPAPAKVSAPIPTAAPVPTPAPAPTLAMGPEDDEAHCWACGEEIADTSDGEKTYKGAAIRARTLETRKLALCYWHARTPDSELERIRTARLREQVAG